MSLKTSWQMRLSHGSENICHFQCHPTSSHSQSLEIFSLGSSTVTNTTIWYPDIWISLQMNTELYVNTKICNLAWDNQPYLLKMHLFILWYLCISYSVHRITKLQVLLHYSLNTAYVYTEIFATILSDYIIIIYHIYQHVRYRLGILQYN